MVEIVAPWRQMGKKVEDRLCIGVGGLALFTYFSCLAQKVAPRI